MEKNEKLLVSIIMTVYNSEKFLDRAIRCVVEQTYPHWELILVEDCSTDSSLSICKEWADKDSRIRLIKQDHNQGCGGSRNTGICAANGDYIGFMDSDDMIHPKMYEILTEFAKREKADIIMCDSVKLQEDDEMPLTQIDGQIIKFDTLEKKQAYVLMFAGSEIDWQYLVLWNKLYKAEIAKAAPISTRGCEDGAFNCTAIRLANGIMKISTKPLYFWVQHSKSITHRSFNKNHISTLETYFDMADEIAVHDPQCFHSVAVKTFKVLLHTRYNGRNTEYRDDVAEFICKRFPDFYKRFWCCKEIGWKWKCLLSIFYYCPFSYNLFRAFFG